MATERLYKEERGLEIYSKVIEDYNDKAKLVEGLQYFTDLDFNGSNGEDYLWDVAKENGCSSNQEYVVKNLDLEKQTEDIISDYFKRWLGADFYYSAYAVDTHVVDEKTLIITVTYTHEV